RTVAGADPFFVVFAICFPAFTGMTAGVGLSGDLKNPRKSIPLGTLTATAIGGIVYVALVVKLAISAPVDELANDQLIMSRIAIWGPIIPIGLGCATLSSAIGCVLIAPRTLQALARDRCFPSVKANSFLAAGIGASNEPRNATLITSALAMVVAALGNVDFVARMDPMCLLMMFQMDPLYAVISLLAMVGLYRLARLGQGAGRDDLAAMVQGVMNQATRFMQIRLQRTLRRGTPGGWRPSVIMVNDRTFDR